ncbi:MAG: efflux RND transporter periplasmic adaptor subunit [Armatimonadetes bacterium]|nr:efflux RND transporter periplasmic adaptor subunit [Armatimonadota bacterium]NIM24569.1 efflux RND transporter periplasmic adaptor subunit [Armatimonadota bacterium]NIM68445.1 efflux RND transporter periplasmic adaptor subunit [Armatimonadota bacterium]NIM76831.1 efflux RND transporter periplasmic adaptor subunit [Armatimonadota bacterium]NIN06642.1 efflux RND transporter periplasmic adaptor subunit [Armatimonadota bacterium]
MRTRRIIAIIAVIIIAAVLIWRALAPPEVSVATVRRGDLTDTLSATGVVEAVQVDVAPKIVGRVEVLLADEGDSVEEGQLIARLDAAELEAALSQYGAALRMAQAEVGRVETALEHERAASKARIDSAQAARKAAQANLQDLRAGARPQEIESARQEVEAAQAEEELAVSEFERMKSLFEGGAVSQAQVDAARARLARARAQLRTAQERLSLLEEGARKEQITSAEAALQAAEAEHAAALAAAGQVAVVERELESAKARAEQAEAAVSAAETALAETEINAPISGRVGRRYVDVGDLTGPGSPLFLIIRGNDLWVIAEVDEEDLSLVHPGQSVEITAEALSAPLPGTVVEVGPVALSRGLEQVRAKIVRCKVVLERGQELLRPGMEVDVSGNATLAQNVLLVPNDAIIESGGEDSVFTVTDKAVHRKQVEVGHRNYLEAEITSGLQEGEVVVIEGGLDLGEGERVAVRREK